MNSIQNIGVMASARNESHVGIGGTCDMDIALKAVPVVNSIEKPSTAPTTGINMSKQIEKLFTKIAPVKLAISRFSRIVELTWSAIVCASSVLKGTKVPSIVTIIERISTKITE